MPSSFATHQQFLSVNSWLPQCVWLLAAKALGAAGINDIGDTSRQRM